MLDFLDIEVLAMLNKHIFKHWSSIGYFCMNFFEPETLLFGSVMSVENLSSPIICFINRLKWLKKFPDMLCTLNLRFLELKPTEFVFPWL